MPLPFPPQFTGIIGPDIARIIAYLYSLQDFLVLGEAGGVAGPQGPPGPTGPTGATGAQGPMGVPGTEGMLITGIKKVSDQSFSAIGDVTSLSFPVTSGKYYNIRFLIIAHSNTAPSDVAFSLTYPTATVVASQGVS